MGSAKKLQLVAGIRIIIDMSLVDDKQKRMKIRAVFNRFADSKKRLPNNRIQRFLEQLGLGSDLFFHDFYFYFPAVEKGADISFEDCLAFIDYIITPKSTNKQIVNVFKLFDKNGIGHIATTELLSFLKKELPAWQYERYAQIISAYGPSINYIDMFQKCKQPH